MSAKRSAMAEHLVRQVNLVSTDGERHMTCNVNDRPDLRVGAVLTLKSVRDPIPAVTERQWRVLHMGRRRMAPRIDWKVDI